MNSDNDDTSTKTLTDIHARIEHAAKEANQTSRSVNLIAVSKTFGPEAILPLLKAGHRVFGENRVQEAKTKWPSLRESYPDIELHLIGPLQSNKTREAIELFDAIHTIDRPKIASAIANEQARTNKSLKLFIQVNTGEEPQKAGIAPRETANFLGHCTDTLGLRISGLMCIPPVEEEPAVHFAFLAKLARELALPELSMGMSSDFETAVAFGASYVRVGSAIFGAR